MMTPKKARVLCLAMLSAATLSANSVAAVKLPEVINDGMVIQRDKPIKVWGQASPGEHVKVEFAGKSQQTVADTSGSWFVQLASLGASATPRTMSVSGENKIVLKDVLVGDVWLASGQSNMEMAMGGLSAPATGGLGMPAGAPIGAPAAAGPGGPAGPSMPAMPTVPEQQRKELANANYPDIRLFRVATKGGPGPSASSTEVTYASWSKTTPESLKEFSAVAYYFAKKIHQEVNVPIGVIQASMGGSAIEPWTPIEEYKRSSVFNADLAADPTSIDGQKVQANYDALIKPLTPFTLRGFLWYQGESNAFGDNRYTEKMRLLVDGWRRAWADDTLGFYYVQIAPYALSKIGFPAQFRKNSAAITPETQAEFWGMQARAQSIPNTGMVVTTDLVDDVNNIHPVNKWDVGQRLALIALAKSYGRKDVIYSGPQYKDIKIVGNEAYLSFNHLGGGLISRDRNPLSDFTIAGNDGKFYFADAKIIGNKVVVSSSSVTSPVAVRFAWNETAQPNLMNKANLPAVPFRTDR